METKRQRQVSELIKRNFSWILQQEGTYIFGKSVLVSVTDVKISPDFTIAKIYISAFNTENKQEVILEMDAQKTRLKQLLAGRIKNQIRRIPEIYFYLDDTVDEMFKVDALFERLHKEGQMGEDEE